MTNDIQHPQAQATDAQDARHTIDKVTGDPAFASFEIPKGLHPNTATLVRDFAEAMAKKLRASEIKYGWTANWMRKGWRDGLAVELLRYVHKGDPIDVAAYAAFAWFHGWSVAPVAASATYGGQVAIIAPYTDEEGLLDPDMVGLVMLAIGRPDELAEHVLDRIPAGAADIIRQHSEAQATEIVRLKDALEADYDLVTRELAERTAEFVAMKDRAIKAEAPLAALSGWKLVPITPTQDMLMAGVDRPQPDPADPRDHEWGGMYRAIYGAMLGASPSPDRVVTALAQIDRALGQGEAVATNCVVADIDKHKLALLAQIPGLIGQDMAEQEFAPVMSNRIWSVLAEMPDMVEMHQRFAPIVNGCLGVGFVRLTDAGRAAISEGAQ